MDALKLDVHLLSLLFQFLGLINDLKLLFSGRMRGEGKLLKLHGQLSLQTSNVFYVFYCMNEFECKASLYYKEALFLYYPFLYYPPCPLEGKEYTFAKE